MGLRRCLNILTSYNALHTVHCALHTTYHTLRTTHCALPTTHYPLPTAHDPTRSAPHATPPLSSLQSLTDQLVNEAMTVIEEVEAMGGMAAAVASGMPKQRIEASAARKQAPTSHTMPPHAVGTPPSTPPIPEPASSNGTALSGQRRGCAFVCSQLQSAVRSQLLALSLRHASTQGSTLLLA